jgi:hypothetical protein
MEAIKMKYSCFIALILSLIIFAPALAQTRPEEELKQAQEVADRFVKRFRETRDLTPLVGEMFSSDFRKLIEEDTSWSGAVGQGSSLVKNLRGEERVRCYLVSFSLDYLIRLYIAGKISADSKETLRSIWSPEMEKFFTEMEKLDGNIKSEKQARNYLSYLERALALMQKEVAKNPPEETEIFSKNLAAFEKHLQGYENEQPAAWVSERGEHGRPARTRFAKFIIPFHVGLLMLKENGQYKIWLALSTLPPD